jgi:hypothetical protein
MTLPYYNDLKSVSGLTVDSGTWMVPGSTPGRFVGFRSNNGLMYDDSSVQPAISYPISYWVSVANRYKAMFPAGIGACGQWIIPRAKVDSFDQAVDDALSAFDAAGVYVYLQVGDGYYNYTPLSTLMDLTLSKYGHHPCVLGWGLDLELIGTDWQQFLSVSDAEASALVNQIRGYNTNFKLFLKHFIESLMPPTVRDGIIFIDDSNGHGSLSGMVSTFQGWGNYFYPADVGFGVGYSHASENNDWYNWIQYLSNPPFDIANAIFNNIANAKWVYWVNVTEISLRTVFPP